MLGNDYGDYRLGENIRSIHVDDVVATLRSRYEQQMSAQPIYLGDQEVKLAHSKTGYGGRRLWFICPACSTRIAKLFNYEGVFVCRHCAGIQYRTSRYKGMIEEDPGRLNG